MLSLLYKAFSVMLVVSVVFFGNHFLISLEYLYKALSGFLVFFMFFFVSDTFQTKLHCSVNNTSSFTLGFLIFFLQ